MTARDRNRGGGNVDVMTALATSARLALAALAAATLVASSRSQSQTAQPQPQPGAWNAAPPPTTAMAPSAATGLWKTTFGAVKIEEDGSGGLHGAWIYQRNGQEVVGYFGGPLDGNVVRFSWREPAQAQPGEAQLAGEGWLSFEPNAGRFSGRWWTYNRDRQGDWTGQRGAGAPAQPTYGDPGYGGNGYGGNGYGGAVYGAPY